MSHLFGGRKSGKLTLSRQQNASEEETGEKTQLTKYEASTKQTSVLQPLSTSATVTDGSQSVSKNIKVSTGSVDSGMGGGSKNSSLSNLPCHTNESAIEVASPATQFSPAHDHTGGQNIQTSWADTMGLQTDPEIESDGCYPNNHLLQIKQSLSEVSTSLQNVNTVVEELRNRVANLELEVQSVQREVLNRTPSGSSIAIAESTPNHLSCSSVVQESPIQEEETKSAAVQRTFLSLPDTAESQFYKSTPEQQKRHYSDSKMTRCRQSEIRKKLGSVVPKSLSEQIDSQTILEDDLLDTEDLEVQEDIAKSHQVKSWSAMDRVTEISDLEQKLSSDVKRSLPKFIERTNWNWIVPHLVSVDLSDHATTDFLLNETKTNQDKGIHFYLRVLPFKGPDAYTRFYRCLCNEKQHLGHKSLLKILND